MTVLPFTRLPRLFGVAGATAALVGSLLVVGATPAFADPVHTPVLGAGKVQADFDGDGYADLVAGATNPDEEDGDTGMTVIFYGSASGLTTAGRQQIDGPTAPCRGQRPVQPVVVRRGCFATTVTATANWRSPTAPPTWARSAKPGRST